VVFLGSSANAESLAKIHFALHAYNAALQNSNFNNFSKTQLSERDPFFVMLLYKHIIQP
jgi:hypothetical protein